MNMFSKRTDTLTETTNDAKHVSVYLDELWNNPKMISNGAMVLQNGTKMEQHDAQMASSLHPDGQRGLKMALGNSKMAPRQPQNAPKMAHGVPKIGPNGEISVAILAQGFRLEQS